MLVDGAGLLYSRNFQYSRTANFRWQQKGGEFETRIMVLL
jgi:hypothetical protein